MIIKTHFIYHFKCLKCIKYMDPSQQPDVIQATFTLMIQAFSCEYQLRPLKYQQSQGNGSLEYCLHCTVKNGPIFQLFTASSYFTLLKKKKLFYEMKIAKLHCLFVTACTSRCIVDYNLLSPLYRLILLMHATVEA